MVLCSGSTKKFKNIFNFFIIIAGLSLIYFPDLGHIVYTRAHETLHALIPKEMLLRKNLLIPYACGHIYYDKFPFFYWVLAFVYWLTGKYNLFWARFPSALSAVFCGYLIYLLSIRWFEGDFLTAIVAPFVWASMSLVYKWGQWCRMDMLLTFFVTLGILSLDKAINDRKLNMWIFSGVAFSFAILSKGFYVIVFYIISAFIIYYLTELTLDTKFFIGLTLGLISVGLLLGFYLFVLYKFYPSYISGLIKYQFGKAVSEHSKPFHYYFKKLPFRLMPWSIFAVGALLSEIKNLKMKRLNRRSIPILIFLISLFIFSLIKNKRCHFLLPITTMVALFISNFIVNCIKSGNNTVCNWGCILILKIVIILFPVIILLTFIFLLLSKHLSWIYLAFLLFLFIMYVLLVSSFVKRELGKFILCLLCIVTLILAWGYPLVRHGFMKRSVELEVVENLSKSIPKNIPLVFYKFCGKYVAFRVNNPIYFIWYKDELINIRFRNFLLITRDRFSQSIFKKFFCKRYKNLMLDKRLISIFECYTAN